MDDQLMIKQHNAAVMAEADHVHRLKQELKTRLIEAMRAISNEFPMSDDGLRPMPKSISAIHEKLLDWVYELDDAKETVELLGQGTEEFRVNLPEWAVLEK